MGKLLLSFYYVILVLVYHVIVNSRLQNARKFKGCENFHKALCLSFYSNNINCIKTALLIKHDIISL